MKRLYRIALVTIPGCLALVVWVARQWPEPVYEHFDMMVGKVVERRRGTSTNAFLGEYDFMLMQDGHIFIHYWRPGTNTP